MCCTYEKTSKGSLVNTIISASGPLYDRLANGTTFNEVMCEVRKTYLNGLQSIKHLFNMENSSCQCSVDYSKSVELINNFMLACTLMI